MQHNLPSERYSRQAPSLFISEASRATLNTPRVPSHVSIVIFLVYSIKFQMTFKMVQCLSCLVLYHLDPLKCYLFSSGRSMHTTHMPAACASFLLEQRMCMLNTPLRTTTTVSPPNTNVCPLLFPHDSTMTPPTSPPTSPLSHRQSSKHHISTHAFAPTYVNKALDLIPNSTISSGFSPVTSSTHLMQGPSHFTRYNL